jgi:heme exporter protein A
MSTFEGHGLGCVRGGRLVFAGLSFAVPPGGALVLAGPNGSGKSSLLRLMAGLTPAAAGRLCWGGEAVADDPSAHRRRLHYVGHLDAIKPALTVRTVQEYRSAVGWNARACSPFPRAAPS